MNREFLIVIGLALMPAFGSFAGGLFSEWSPPSKEMLNRALHGAAGIILAVISVEVMPEALGKASPWILALAFMAGGGLYLLIENWVKRWSAKQVGPDATAWIIYLAVVIDLAGDGLLLGVGSVVSSTLALLMALGQVLAAIPAGFAAIANFRDKGASGTKRLLLSIAFAIPIVSTTVLAYLVLRGQSESVQTLGLVFVAGLRMLAAIEGLLPEAHGSAKDTQWSAISFMVGFSVFLVMSGILG